MSDVEALNAAVGTSMVSRNDELAERLRQVAESYRMDLASPSMAAMFDEAADALEGLVSAPTGDDEEQTDILQDLIDCAAKPSKYPQNGIGVSNPREIADVIIAAGFRLPVVPVSGERVRYWNPDGSMGATVTPTTVLPTPVYEYRRVDQNGRVRFGAEFSSMPLLDEGWSAERRTVGVWEPVPVGVEK